MVDDASKVNFPRLNGSSEHISKGFGQSYGVERHLYVDTTNEGRFDCTHVDACERLSRGERDRIRCLKCSVWDACIDDAAMVSILFPDGKDSTVMTGPVRNMITPCSKRARKSSLFSRAALAHTRVDIPLRQPTVPLSFHLRCLSQQFCTPTNSSRAPRLKNHGAAGPARQRPAERGARVCPCDFEQPRSSESPGPSNPLGGGHACAAASATALREHDCAGVTKNEAVLTAPRHRSKCVNHLVLQRNAAVTVLKPTLGGTAKNSTFISQLDRGKMGERKKIPRGAACHCHERHHQERISHSCWKDHIASLIKQNILPQEFVREWVSSMEATPFLGEVHRYSTSFKVRKWKECDSRCER